MKILGRDLSQVVIVDVKIMVFRIIILLGCFIPITFIGSSSLMEIWKIDSSADCLLFWNIFMEKVRSCLLGIWGKSFRKWKSTWSKLFLNQIEREGLLTQGWGSTNTRRPTVRSSLYSKMMKVKLRRLPPR